MDTSTPTVTEATEVKPKGRAKGKGKPAPVAKGKRSLNLSLPVEVYERLAVHSIRLDTTISDLVAKLAVDHLREFHITRTGRPEVGGE